jgi:uncharacterized protein with PQ loop repeat
MSGVYVDLSAVIGLAATILSTLILFPSVVEQYLNKTQGKLSIRMLSQVVLVNILWITYGYLEGDIYVAGRSFVGMLISATSVYFYFKYKGQAKGA